MEYSVRLSLVEPGGEARRAPLRIALRDAAAGIGLFGNLKAGEGVNPCPQ